MFWYHFMLLAMAILSTVMAWNVPRAKLWIAAISASYIASVIYTRIDPPNPPFPAHEIAAFFLDFVVIVLIRQLHHEKWEATVATIVLIMASLNFYQTLAMSLSFAEPMSGFYYSASLEILNAVALLFIAGVGTVDRARHIQHMLGHNYRAGVVKACNVAAEAARARSTATKITSL